MTIINGERCCAPIINGRRRCGGTVSLVPGGGLGGGDGGGGGGEETIRVRMGPSGDLRGNPWASLDGVGASSALGTWMRLTDEDYIYVTHNDGVEQVGPDPGQSEAVLAGLSGIEVPAAEGNRTRTQMAEHLRAALEVARPDWTLTVEGDEVFITGEFEPAILAGGSYADRGANSGVYGTRDMVSVSSFAVDTMRMMQLADVLPALPGRVVGMRYLSGDAAAGSAVRLGLGVGGSAGATAGVSIEAQKRCASQGPDTWNEVYFAPGDVYYSEDLSAETFWGVIAGDGDAGAISAENVGNGHAHDWVVTGTQVLYITAQSTGSATPFPDIATASIGGNAFGIFIQLIVQVGPYYGNGEYLPLGGADPDTGTDTFDSTSNMRSIHVGWVFPLPEIPDLTIYEVAVFLEQHGATQQVHMDIRDNVQALQDPDGETTVYDFGQTSGDAAGWNVFAPDGGVAVSGGLYRLNIKSNGSAPPGATQLGFVTGPHDQADTPEQWRFYGGASTEVEYTLASGETNIPFDPATPTPSPLNPSSAVLTPGNAGGLYIRFGHEGISAIV